ncbi:MAG: inositol monophosphatase [Pseudomonadota bacterium]
MTDLAPLLTLARSLAERAGHLAVDLRRDPDTLATSRKGGVDLVTLADTKVEAFIRAELATHLPDHTVLGEEEGGTLGAATWVLDPVDGTENYASGFPFWCVSLAFCLDSTPVLGVVHDPLRGETFHAARGLGASLNDTALPLTLPQGVTLGYSFGLGSEAKSERTFAAVTRAAQTGRRIRSPGAGALATTYVGAGRLACFFEQAIHFWDIAAAQVIVEETGGHIRSDFDPSDPTGGFSYCAWGAGEDARVIDDVWADLTGTAT